MAFAVVTVINGDSDGIMIVIYGELYSSKNSKRIVKFGNRPALIASSQYLKSIKPIEQQLILNRCKWLEMIKNTNKPFKIVFKIYRKTHRKFDYLNIVQGLQDLMVKCGWLSDDNADEIIPYFEPYEVDKTNPRTVIKIIS